MIVYSLNYVYLNNNYMNSNNLLLIFQPSNHFLQLAIKGHFLIDNRLFCTRNPVSRVHGVHLLQFFLNAVFVVAVSVQGTFSGQPPRQLGQVHNCRNAFQFLYRVLVGIGGFLFDW